VCRSFKMMFHYMRGTLRMLRGGVDAQQLCWLHCAPSANCSASCSVNCMLLYLTPPSTEGLPVDHLIGCYVVMMV